MPALLLKARLAFELPHINKALYGLLDTLPAPSRPAATHTVKAGGKRLRPLLTVLSSRLFGCRDEQIYRLASTLEMLHAATLIHDDVIDDADTRRGNPAAHKVFGTTESILAGDALLSAANACVAEFGSPELCRLYAKATYETAAGEILELHAMHNCALTAAEYTDIIRGKTACLIRSACEMGAVFAGASTEQTAAVAAFGENIGMAFQIVDDALDCAPESVIGKPTGGDIREGKLTPPIRMYRDTLSPDERKAFDVAFTQGTFPEDEVLRIAGLIREQGFDTKTRELADRYLDTARSAIEQLPDCSERGLLRDMADYVRDRKK